MLHCTDKDLYENKKDAWCLPDNMIAQALDTDNMSASMMCKWYVYVYMCMYMCMCVYVYMVLQWMTKNFYETVHILSAIVNRCEQLVQLIYWPDACASELLWNLLLIVVTSYVH